MRATNCERNILSKMEIKLRSWLVLLACRIRRHCVKKKNNLQEYSAHVAEQITMDHIIKKIVGAFKKKRERQKKKHVQIIPSMTPSDSRDEQVGRKNLG